MEDISSIVSHKRNFYYDMISYLDIIFEQYSFIKYRKYFKIYIPIRTININKNKNQYFKYFTKQDFYSTKQEEVILYYTILGKYFNR